MQESSSVPVISQSSLSFLMEFDVLLRLVGLINVRII